MPKMARYVHVGDNEDVFFVDAVETHLTTYKVREDYWVHHLIELLPTNRAQAVNELAKEEHKNFGKARKTLPRQYKVSKQDIGMRWSNQHSKPGETGREIAKRGLLFFNN